MPLYEFTSPEGKTYEVSAPEGGTREQAFQILQKQIAAPTEPAEEESYFKRVGNRFEESGEKIGKTIAEAEKRGEKPPENPLEADIDALYDALSIGGDIVEGGWSVFGEAYNEIPKEYRKKFERVFGESTKTLYNALNIGGGLDVATQQMVELAEDYPKQVGAAEDIVQITGAKKLLGGLKQLGSKATIHRWGDVVMPAPSKQELKRRALNSKPTVLGTDKPVVQPWQEDMINVLKKVEGVHPANRNQINVNAVINGISDRAKKLEKKLVRSKAKIDKDAVKLRVQQNLYDQFNDNPVFDGYSPKELERVTARVNRMIDEAGNSPNDLWKARKKLDAFYEWHKGEKFVGGNVNAGPASEAYRIARNSMNEALESTVPGSAPALKEMATLYNARDILVDKAILDDPALIGRMKDRLSEVVTLRPAVVRVGYYGPSNLK